MHTAFVKNIPAPGGVVELEKREHDHLFKTLRCRAGEQFRLCDGCGTAALAEATAEKTVRVLERSVTEAGRIAVHLFAALPRNAKLDLLLKPATEAGVRSITPLKCRYSVSEKSTVPERWYTLLEEACKQSGNPFLPPINPAMNVAESLKYCAENNYLVFFGAQHGKLLLPEDLPVEGKLDIAWFVGPEGGFSGEEIAALESAGQGITLGEYIFRLENAALAGIAYLYTVARTAEVKK